MLVLFRAIRGLAIASVLFFPSVARTQSADGQEAMLEVRQFDRVTEKNGKVWEGIIEDETPLHFWLNMRIGGRRRFDIQAEVESILRRNPPPQVYRERARRLHPDSVDEQLSLARWCLSAEVEGELQGEALTHLEDASRLDPTAVAVYELLLPIYEDADDRQKTLARRDAEFGVCLAGLDAGVELPQLARRAAIHLELLGDAAGAVKLLQRALALETRDPEKQSIESNLARLLEASGQRSEAKALVDRILEEDSGRGLDLLLLRAGWLLENLAAGDTEAGSELDTVREQLVQLVPSNGSGGTILGEMELVLASARVLEGDFDAARQHFGRALQRGVAGYRLDLTYAQLAAREGDSARAEQMANQAKNVSAPVAQELFHLVRAYLFENRGELDAAWHETQAAVAVENASWQTWLIYLSALPRLRPESSLADSADFFLKKFSSNAVAFAECALLLGDAALRENNGADARRWFEYASEELGADRELLLRSGLAELLPGGSLVRARNALEAAYQLAPDALDTRNAFGCLEYRDGHLDLAERWFTGVLDEFDTDEQEASEPPVPLAYALRALRQIDGAVAEELWADGFDREDAGTILNNWEPEATYGIALQQRGGHAEFDGKQQFAADGLTLVTRTIEGGRLSRIRARFKFERGASLTTVALRFEERSRDSGLIFFRDSDGVLSFAITGSDGVEDFRPPETVPGEDDGSGEDDGGENDDPHDLKRFVWVDDGQWHRLEIRLDPERNGTAELYFDGERVARNVRVPRGGREGYRVGVSGQAGLGVSYRFLVDDFEIYRRRPQGGETKER